MDRPSLLMMGAYPSWDLEALEVAYSVAKLWESSDPGALIAGPAARARGVATRGDLGLPRGLMDALPLLEIIACYGVGTDAIDLVEARRRGIRVTNTPDVLTEDVADLAFGLMLATSRRMVEADRFVRNGAWTTTAWPLTARLHGKRLGIAGLGRIGEAVARRGAAFGMPIHYFSRGKKPGSPYQFHPSLTELAASCDILVATMAGGAGTAKIINQSVFEALGPSGLFINVARGSVVDEEALIEALKAEKIAGAGLDVFLNEPSIDPRFLNLPNTVLQPHQGSGTLDTRRAMGQLVRDNLSAHFSGRPLLTPVV